jgi:hypothetical protein
MNKGRQVPSSANGWRDIDWKLFLSLELILGKSVIWISSSRQSLRLRSDKSTSWGRQRQLRMTVRKTVVGEDADPNPIAHVTRGRCAGAGELYPFAASICDVTVRRQEDYLVGRRRFSSLLAMSQVGESPYRDKCC